MIHDYLYKARWLSRREADGVLLEALEAAGGVMVATLANVGGCAGVRWAFFGGR